MIRGKKLITLDEDISKKLDIIAQRYGMTANTLIAAAACELARIRPENLWHALGRIAEGDEAAELPAPAKSRRGGPGRLPATITPELVNGGS